MKEIKIIILLTIMILVSLFSGIPINKNWSFVYQFEFLDFPKLHETSIVDTIIWCTMLLSHIGIIVLPFCIKNKFFKKMLWYFPLTFLLSFLILEAGFFILLIPFMIIWLIALNVSKEGKM
ncbi:hypothetical protein D7004_06245 [Pedobacter jejuensis]|uniref:Uncharacterized protein n=1 Tax=Pedobacter jejuensis TaxID=1268550 RepID=A0A3N0BY62_9SPHI|nr:hypothetical protein D7004_06245 [Pedobacter jejuensis]